MLDPLGTTWPQQTDICVEGLQTLQATMSSDLTD